MSFMSALLGLNKTSASADSFAAAPAAASEMPAPATAPVAVAPLAPADEIKSSSVAAPKADEPLAVPAAAATPAATATPDAAAPQPETAPPTEATAPTKEDKSSGRFEISVYAYDGTKAPVLIASSSDFGRGGQKTSAPSADGERKADNERKADGERKYPYAAPPSATIKNNKTTTKSDDDDILGLFLCASYAAAPAPPMLSLASFCSCYTILIRGAVMGV